MRGSGDEVHRVCSPVPLLYIQTAPHRTPFRLEAHWSATCRALRLLSFEFELLPKWLYLFFLLLL